MWKILIFFCVCVCVLYGKYKMMFNWRQALTLIKLMCFIAWAKWNWIRLGCINVTCYIFIMFRVDLHILTSKGVIASRQENMHKIIYEQESANGECFSRSCKIIITHTLRINNSFFFALPRSFGAVESKIMERKKI